ncbi:MAG: hypothetical protein AAB614_00920 [Patescibacteria group bacterium]
MQNLTLKQSILSTLAHYEAERGLPLSTFEIYKYLHKGSFDRIILSQIIIELQKIIKNDGVIKNKNGFFSLNEIEEKCRDRIYRDKLSIKKWRKTKKIISLMQSIPFIKSISVSGSLSMNNIFLNSDIDLFIITKKGKIWTTRTLSMLLIQLIGQRRHNKKIDNKICLNYYISENSDIPIKNMASANIFLRMIPIFEIKLYQSFLQENYFWIKKYFQKSKERLPLKNFREIKRNGFLLFLKKISEYILSGNIGNGIELMLSRWQKKRIAKKIYGLNNVTNLIFTNEILMFHYPNPRNEAILIGYKNIMDKIKQ